VFTVSNFWKNEMQNASKSKPVWVWSALYECVVRIVGKHNGALYVELPDGKIIKTAEEFKELLT
jgi:hypothetical protein